MGAFSTDWLALREPADHAARSAALTDRVRSRLPPGIGVLDLAAGTGSNLRYLATRLVPPQRWLLVDHDEALLAEVRRGRPVEDPGVTLRWADIGNLTDDLFEDRALVTASALLDLVSASWLSTLAERCHAHGATVLFALTYDGRIECTPGEPEDQRVRDLVNRHQGTDKGFGPALGPGAASAAARCFSALGYEVRREPSDWVLGSESAELQRQLVNGWASAAGEIDPAANNWLREWRDRRLAHVEAERSRFVVGHLDLAGWPKEM
jgi:hypothetical protein